MKTRLSKTITILCYGNPAREDDGLGPAVAQRLEEAALPNVRVESDYQLMVEDATAIAESSLVVFTDAAVEGEEPYSFTRLPERVDLGYMAHTIGPEALLGLTRATFGRCPPAYALAIRGYSFDMFKEGLTPRAAANLEEAVRFLTQLLEDGAGELIRPDAARAPCSKAATATRNAGAGECTSGGLK